MRATCIDFLRSAGVRPGDGVLCAVSGGGDSVCLLRLMADIAPELELRVAAAHFNHRLRENAGRDADHVRRLCAAWDIPCFLGSGDVLAASGGAGVEEKAREMRYAFLEETAAREGYGWIATAHNADDVLETVLLDLTRGSGRGGLAGIPAVRGNILRPLLRFSGADLRAFLTERGIAWQEDETNAEAVCARNLLRLRVTPVLRQLNPHAAEHAARTAEKLARDEAFLEDLAARALEGAAETAEDISVPAAALRDAHPALSTRMVRLLGRRLGVKLSESHVEAVLALCRGTSPSAKADLPGGLEALRRYDALLLRKRAPREPLPETALRWGDNALGPDLTVNMAPGEKVYNSEMIFSLARGKIGEALYVRSRRTGDRLRLRGRPEKTLKELFIEKKIPRDLRDNIPVFTAEDGTPVAVGGLGADERFLAREGEANITLTIRPEP